LQMTSTDLVLAKQIIQGIYSAAKAEYQTAITVRAGAETQR